MIWLARPRSVFVIALVILLPVQLIGIVQDPWFQLPPKPIGDGLEYENIGFHLWMDGEYAVRNKDVGWTTVYAAAGEEYQAHLRSAERSMLTTGRPPLYPTLIAFVYWGIGRNEVSFGLIRLCSGLCLALAGGLSAAVTTILLQPRIRENDSSLVQMASLLGIWLPVFLFAINRTLKSYSTDFLTEPLALLLMQCFVLSVVIHFTHAAHETPRSGFNRALSVQSMSLIGSGILFSGLILTRSIFVLWLPGIWLLWFLATSARARLAAGRASLVVVVILLSCLPWWVRNVRVLGEFMPLGTQGPITLLGAYSDAGLAAGGEWQPEPEQQLRKASRAQQFNQITSDEQREVLIANLARKEVEAWIGSNWRSLPGMFVSRIVTHWSPYWGPSLIWKILAITGLATLLFTPWSDSKRRKIACCWLLGLPMLSTLITAVLYTTGGRFLVPLYGVLFSLAGIGLACALQNILSGLQKFRSDRQNKGPLS